MGLNERMLIERLAQSASQIRRELRALLSGAGSIFEAEAKESREERMKERLNDMKSVLKRNRPSAVPASRGSTPYEQYAYAREQAMRSQEVGQKLTALACSMRAGSKGVAGRADEA
jgi:ElaB/YqjD/DUF883 family membrane-anchored ribosome-binding protein